MEKIEKNYFGILINNKIPDLENKENKYYKNVILKFQGQAFIVDSNNLREKQELKNGCKLKDDSEYLIKFINEKQDIFFIKIKIQKLFLLWLFLFCLLAIIACVLCFNNNDKKINVISEFSNFDIEFEGCKYVFDINARNQSFQNIRLIDNFSKKDFIYPGSNGNFYIVISTILGNKDMEYTMQIQEETNKPSNLKFKYNNIIYNSLNDLAKDVNGDISKNSTKILKINWFWEYESYDDKTDTNDAMLNEIYNFKIRMIGKEKS